MIKKRSLFAILNNHVIDYPTPVNINYFWSLGVLAGICLVIQLITGIFLAMHYTPHIDYAFTSVEHIMRDVNNGWTMRYIHANGASMFFIVVYTHICRGLYYSSYTAPRHILWCTGVIIFLMMMATGFIGYVLPWGQMSFWGATVITNLFSAIPVFGEIIVQFLWGGFSVDNATLNRFLSLHYLLPFVIAGLSLVHLALVHANGNGNPLGVESKTYNVSFAPYSLHIKYIFVTLCMLSFFMFLVCFYPNLLGHSDNYIPANPMVTPAHIVPEWYFLPFYAILRSIPDKLGGVIAMVGAILLLMALPFITPTLHTRSSAFRPITRKLFWLQIGNCMVLGWIGGNIVETPFIEIGQIATVFYFLYFLVLLPGGAWLEVYLMRNLKH
jgi:ubiquinol-cytochrome c reductase cytochrome b subunit|tara:strand:- start:603 stop:1754 length:1152 start_codon:yes stop_codon:yes gene_type:complete